MSILIDSTALATYNAEVSRGIMHTEEYKAQMKEQQAEYDIHGKPSDLVSNPPSKPFYIQRHKDD